MGILTDLLGSRLVVHKVDDRSEAKARYRCVQIHAGASGGCAAVAALEGRRFLPEEIPQLPLADCERSRCDCRYELHEDRRSQERNADDTQ